jgi:hypothetical protein
MANSKATNPLVLDSTGVVLTGPVSIKAILFTAANADGLLLSDAEGNKVASLEASTGDLSPTVTVPGGIKVNGLTVTTIDGGIAYIYLK